jgi:hypothetical protein
MTISEKLANSAEDKRRAFATTFRRFSALLAACSALVF